MLILFHDQETTARLVEWVTLLEMSGLPGAFMDLRIRNTQLGYVANEVLALRYC
jgi:hypothetical protein